MLEWVQEIRVTIVCGGGGGGTLDIGHMIELTKPA